MRVLNINARSIVNKSVNLESVILSYNPHVVVLTETWLHDDIDDTAVFPPSYQAYRRDRSSRGGGVAVLVKENISAVLLRQANNLETVSLKLSCWGKSFLLFAVYRAPNSSAQYLCDLCEHIASFTSDNVLLIGDFNLPGIDWENASLFAESNLHVNYLRNIMLYHNLQQVVKHPTRIHDTSATILDLVFVSQSIETFTVSVEPGISDHQLVYFTCPLNSCVVSKKNTVTIKDYSRANDESVLDYLEICLDSFQGHDITALWHRFKEIINHCLRNFIPSKTKRTSKVTPWISRDILHLKRRVKRLRRRHASREAIQEIQSNLNQKVGHAKRWYFQHILPEFIRSAPQKFWAFLRKKNREISHIVHDGNMVSEKHSIAQHFNEYFHSVFSNIDTSAFRDHTPCDPAPDIVSTPGVVSMLLKLKTKSSPGPDDIPNIFLRRYAEALAPFITRIFQMSLSSATLPSDWLSARVVPVLKKGDATLVTNYRPISLTSSCCKLLEHIIAKEINNFIGDNSILSSCQHGFRKGFSTTTQLTSIVHNFASVLDGSGQVDVLFLDFKKAFDLVSHRKLIDKLESINLPTYIVNWVDAYLTNRRQFVSINNHSSSELPVSSGVPQGSVLGPLLFLIFINDITNEINAPVQIKLFADDCVLYNEINCPEDQVSLNSNLQSIVSWCSRWSMELNANKTVYMSITNKKFKKLPFVYKLGSELLTEVSEYKYLGITITNTLSWNTHISNICNSSFKKLCFLRHKLKHTPASTRLTAYTSLIRPKLEYACVVWDPYTKTNIDTLEMIQRKAVRFIFSKYRNSDSPSSLMTQHSIQPLQLRRKIQRLKFMFSLKNNLLAINPSHYLEPLTARRTRHRHADSLTPYRTRTNLFKYSFFPRTITDWNNLPFSLLSNADLLEHVII